MSQTCRKDDSIVVGTGCVLTAAEWRFTPGTCRLRVKNFNAADWVATGCNLCTNAAGTTWDGTFPVFVVGVGYAIDPSVGNIGGKQPLFAATNVTTNTSIWEMAIDCAPNSRIWLSDGTLPFASGPVGVYTRFVGCVASATFELEGYIP